ncbi:MAG: acetyl-CoA carboxylase, carboxyltransferase subunit beta [Catonella sp.]|uniref:acetyl-CoA carboxylase, carboxyltransferase subunit beta n=1 Tax=Catonella sp. TaxID=2382125 RepID=UPI003F9FFAA9
MKIAQIFSRKKDNLNALNKARREKNNRVEEGISCPSCDNKLERNIIKENLGICPKCNYYFPLSPMQRMALLSDEKQVKKHFHPLKSINPIDFPNYEEKLKENREKTRQSDAIVTEIIKIGGISTAVGVLDGRFLLGSMGTVVGEEIARLAEYAKKKKLPLVIFSASGGARMQEGIFSLMQMAKTAAAVERYKQSGGLFISVLTNPTTGGVSASFASLGDITIAEPNALICFAGPRVIEQTIGEKLPEGFQRAEFLLEHGRLDAVIGRVEMKEWLTKVLKLHSKK